MQAGQMRKRIVIQQRSGSRDDYGGQPQSWSDVASAWAQILPTAGKEVEAGNAVRAMSNYTITMRYRSDITPKHRIKYGAKYLNIININDVDERHRELIILANEGLNPG